MGRSRAFLLGGLVMNEFDWLDGGAEWLLCAWLGTETVWGRRWTAAA